MSDIAWCEPPPSRYIRQTGTKAFVEALKARPGEWALYPTSLSSASGAAVYRRNHPGTEWTARHREDGRYDIYARWVGAA